MIYVVVVESIHLNWALKLIFSNNGCSKWINSVGDNKHGSKIKCY